MLKRKIHFKHLLRGIPVGLLIISSSVLASDNNNQLEEELFAQGKLEPLRAIDSGELPNTLNDATFEFNTFSNKALRVNSRHKIVTKGRKKKARSLMVIGSNTDLMSTSSFKSMRLKASAINIPSRCGDSCPSALSASAFLEEMLNEYETTPFYYGLVKDESLVVKDKSGNPFELASLYSAVIDEYQLVYDWNYLLGRVRLTPEQLTQYVGVDDVMEAAKTLIAAGYGVTGLKDQNGNILWVEFNHVWLQVKETESSPWVSVDPSFKSHSIPQKKNLNEEAGILPTTLLNDLEESGAFSDLNGIMQPDIQLIEDFTDRSQELMHSYLEANQSISYEETVDRRKPIKAMYNGFGDDLPYTISGSTTKSKEFGVNHNQRVKVTVGGINHTVNMRDVFGRRLTISYIGATAADQSTIDENGGLLGLPYKGVNIKPVLKADGEALATGNSVQLGTYQTLTVSFYVGTKSDGSVSHNITVGGIHAIALGLNHVSPSHFDDQVSAFKVASVAYHNNAMDERYAGSLLHVLGLSYNKQLENVVTNISSGTGTLVFRKVSEALMSIDLTAERDDTGQYHMAVGSRGIDAPRNIYSIFPNHINEPVNKASVLFSLGIATSGLEHAVFEKSLGWPANSTMSILRFAASHEVPIYVIRQDNLAQALSEIEMPENLEASLSTAVDSGRIVIIPKEQLKIGGWYGIGYIIFDPNTGAAGYMINGGNAGGKQNFEPMNKAETNEIFSLDVAKIEEAFTNGVLRGDFDNTDYGHPLYNSINETTVFISDFFFIGDVRNIGMALLRNSMELNQEVTI